MKVWMKKTGHILLQCAPLLVMLAITAAILLSCEEITVDTILNYTPEKTLPAILMLLMMYALKSLSVVFPMIVLYMASGIMFPLPLAILVNCIGLCIVVTIPYCIGRYSGGELIGRLRQKYPKIDTLQQFQQKHDTYFVYMVRVIGGLPGDVVSMYMGASRIAYLPYIGGCFGGMFLKLCLQTIMGTAVNDPTSPQFWGAVLWQVLLVVASGAGGGIYYRNKHKNGKEQK